MCLPDVIKEHGEEPITVYWGMLHAFEEAEGDE